MFIYIHGADSHSFPNTYRLRIFTYAGCSFEATLDQACGDWVAMSGSMVPLWKLQRESK
jgi:hypothetical protein